MGRWYWYTVLLVHYFLITGAAPPVIEGGNTQEHEFNENTQDGATVMTFQADVSSRYVLSGPDKDLFVVSPSLDGPGAKSALLVIKKSPNWISKSLYNLEMIAIPDADITKVMLTLNLARAPTFLDENLTKSVCNNIPPGTTVATVNATGHTGRRLVYSLGTSEGSEHFTLFDPNAGHISLAPGKTLKDVSPSTFVLVVYATDNGSPPQTGTTTVTLHATDCVPDTGANPSGSAFVVCALYILTAALVHINY